MAKKAEQPKEYRFYDFEGKARKITLSGDIIDISENTRCLRDGVKYVVYSGDPHNIVQCPNCGYMPSRIDEYSREKDLAELTEKISCMESQLALLKATRKVVSNPDHAIVRSNLMDLAMHE